MTSLTSELTIPVKAAPTTMPTARSIAFPRIANALNSERMLMLYPTVEDPKLLQPPESRAYRLRSGSEVRSGPALAQRIEHIAREHRPRDRACAVGKAVQERGLAANISLNDLDRCPNNDQSEHSPFHFAALL